MVSYSLSMRTHSTPPMSMVKKVTTIRGRELTGYDSGDKEECLFMGGEMGPMNKSNIEDLIHHIATQEFLVILGCVVRMFARFSDTRIQRGLFRIM